MKKSFIYIIILLAVVSAIILALSNCSTTEEISIEQQILSKIAVSNYELDLIRKRTDEIILEYKKNLEKCDE